MLEQIPVNEKLKKWIDDISETFGGLEICSIEAVVAKDGKEHIIEACLLFSLANNLIENFQTYISLHRYVDRHCHCWANHKKRIVGTLQN